MNAAAEPLFPEPALPPLPEPGRTRWQPLRLGLVELYRYDSEEFWFRDGHLLLRGNNGTGKSKVLSLTLPLLLDANLRSARVEPDGDPGKKMAWNLLMGGAYERRSGYAWIEFGRLADDGRADFVTLGVGLSAAAARPGVDAWWFVVDGGARVGRDVWLTSAQRLVHTRERLRETLGAAGQVFESAQAYRRAVDERLYQLGPARYAALIDTLIQLRQPQLSRRPDEGALSAALTEALPPLPQDLLADVAEALTQLEDDRRQLEQTRALLAAVRRFERQYRLYAGIASRREARALRQRQTDFDNASRTRHDALAALAAAVRTEAAAAEARARADRMLAGARHRLETLQADPLNGTANQLELAQQDARRREQAAAEAESDQRRAADELAREETATTAQRAAVESAAGELQRLQAAARAGARDCGLLAEVSAEALVGTPTDDDRSRSGTAAEASADPSSLARPAVELRGEPSSSSRPAAAARDDAPSALAPPTADGGDAEFSSLSRPAGEGRGEGAPSRVEAARAADLAAASQRLLALPARRREQIALVRRRIEQHAAAWRDAGARHEAANDAAAEADAAAERRAEADGAVETAGSRHLDAWAAHADALRELRVDADALLAALADWLPRADGAHPGLAALQAAHGDATRRLAAQRHAIGQRRREADAERAALAAERESLQRGEDAPPPPPPWRGADTRAGRPGAPFWQLVDFDAALPPPARDAVESALAASGLLDAWVTPAGDLVGDGTRWHDARLVARRPVAGPSLAAWLRPDGGAGGVAADAVAALLAAVACGDRDDGESEAWMGIDGRFRVAGLAGAARPEPARHVGHAARAAARARRLAEVTVRDAELALALAELDAEDAAADRRAARIDAEWRDAPTEQPLRRAHEAAAAAQREFETARRRADEARTRWQRADEAARTARDALQADAADLRLPADAAALDAVDARLLALAATLQALAPAARLLAQAHAADERQAERLAAARERSAQAGHRLESRRVESEEARTRLGALLTAYGDDVQALRQRIAKARALVRRVEQARDHHDAVLRAAAAGRARAEQRGADADAAFGRAGSARAAQVDRWGAFVATGLLASALAGESAIDADTARESWTIEPALQLARRAEQALAELDDGDERWRRVQSTLAEDLAQLQRELGALSQQVYSEPNDFGISVRVFWHQQPRSPAELAVQLDADLQAREALLSAREREVLENHLQAEIASRIQQLMRAADRHTRSVNAELHKRPTSTGVRFRLVWEPRPDGDGAPAGFAATREKLLAGSADLWSADDRRAVGALLQQRIQDERRRGETALDAGGSLQEQLAAALDYRRWHLFRVERLQDGQWRRLSGPASSGERALGLTVPLFAAVASFYRDSPAAPRLMMLDEAFAGIDDAARAHCMGLVHEFDLDFVLTSEREWGCYATLPGVSICQLQRREGIDAVFVSRWTWDGAARRREPEVARRFPQAESA